MADDTSPPRAYARETLEFERVAFFSDAIFAIALTLLVVALDPPDIVDSNSSKALWDALDDMSPQILMFFVSFAVLGSFWLNHHRFFGRLETIDRPTMVLDLCYLAFIAFLPFPTAVLGEYGHNSVAVSIFATCIAFLAILSLILNEMAARRRLLREPATPETVRWERILALVPACYFLASIAIAAVSPTAAIWSWLGLFPVNAALSHRVPKAVNDYFAS